MAIPGCNIGGLSIGQAVKKRIIRKRELAARKWVCLLDLDTNTNKGPLCIAVEALSP